MTTVHTISNTSIPSFLRSFLLTTIKYYSKFAYKLHCISQNIHTFNRYPPFVKLELIPIAIT